MSFWTILMSAFVFIVISVVVGSFWFYMCVWNDALRGRDFRVLVVTIPVTIFLMFFFVGAPQKMAGSQVEVLTPSPSISPTPVKKKRHKKKKIKMDEEGNPIAPEESEGEIGEEQQ